MSINNDKNYEEIYTEMKTFLSDSSKFYNKDIERAKDDLIFASGDQFKGLLESLHREHRQNRQFSEIQKYIQAIKSSASKSPFHTELSNNTTLSEQSNAESIEEYQVAFDKIEADTSFKEQMMQSLESAIVTGVGVSCLTTVLNPVTNEPEIKIESIRDISKVAFDRDAVSDDKSDAEAGAIINYISKRKAKREYSEAVLEYSTADCKLPDQWVVPENSVPLITYYRKGDNNDVEYYKFCGRTCVADEIINIPMIPLFKMTGYIIFRDDKFTSVGIIDKIKDLQIGANLAYSNLIERLNRSVKSGYICVAEAIEGLEDQISKLSEGEVPLFLYKNGFEKPTPITEAFNTNDLVDVINTSITLMSNTIGIPSAGIQGIKNQNTTATEVLIQEANSESNVSCFYDSYEKVDRNISKCILSLLTGGTQNNILIKLINGPSVITRNAKRRQEISLMSSMMDEKTKPLMAKYYADSLDDDLGKSLSANIVANLDPSVKLIETTQDPTAIHQLKQMQQLTDSTMSELEKCKQTIDDLTKQNETLNISLLDNREARQVDMQKAILSNQTETNTKLAELALKDKEIANDFQIKQQQLQLDVQKELNTAIEQNNEVIYGVASDAEAPEGMRIK
jgi:hypothetical protein